MNFGLGLGFGARRHGGVSLPFTPAGISNLVAWYDASDTSTITHSSGAVSQWNDKSGNLYHATQGTGTQQPITGTRTVNGLNALDFDGPNDMMVLPSGTFGISSADSSLYYVFASDLTTTERTLIIGKDTGNSVTYGATLYNAGLRSYHNVWPTYASQAITRDTGAHIWSLYRNGSSMKQAYDGIFSAPQTAVNASLSYLRIGISDNNNQYYNGLACEIILVGRSVSTGEDTDIRAYLKSKWGTP